MKVKYKANACYILNFITISRNFFFYKFLKIALKAAILGA